MLKSRNSFFSESSMNYQNYYPNYNMQQPFTPQMNVQSGSAQNTFYSGPVPNQNFQQQYNGMNPNQTPYYNNYDNMADYDNRLAKIERQINRLDSRVTKLEQSAKIISDDVSSSLYMV